MSLTFWVVETYRDGTVWRHAYPTRQDAERNMRAMQEANKGRSYELLPGSGS